MTANTCAVQYELRLADGQVFDFWGHGRAPGSASGLEMLDDGGLPPLEHRSQSVYGVPGDMLLSLDVQARVVTLTTTLYGSDRASLRRSRGALLSALRWDRGLKDTDPMILRATLGADSWDLNLTYSGLVTAQRGRHGTGEVVAVRLIAHDGFWYDPDTEEAVLDWSDQFTTNAYLERTTDGWGKLITQPVAITPDAGAVRVWAIAKDSTTGDVYFGGRFLDWDNNVLSDYLVRWHRATDTWQNVGDDGAGGPALNGGVVDMCFDPTGTYLYVAGYFTSAGGIGATGDWLAQVDVRTDTWSAVGGGHGAAVVTQCSAVAFAHDGTFLLGGIFTNWAGSGADYFVTWDGAAWAALGGVDPDNHVRKILVAPNGDIYICGDFLTIGVPTYNRIAYWDGAWQDLDSGVSDAAYDMAFGLDGTLYAVGAFANAGSAPTTVNFIARWNGSQWSDLDGGANGSTNDCAIASDGSLWVSGNAADQFGSVPLHTRLARWNGYSWTHADMGFDNTVFGMLIDGDEIYLGHGQNPVTIGIAGVNRVVVDGSAFSYPVIEIKNAGYVKTIINETTDQEIPFAMELIDGQIVTIDLTTGYKTVTDTWLGNLLGRVLPASDLGTFKLESYPRANYGGAKGTNLLAIFIDDAAAREHNDGGNQLSGWDNITGISQDNTDLGRLYASIVADGGGFYHVDLYSDAARTDLVGHTGTYNGAGAQAVIEDAASGMAGSLTVDAVVGADVDIHVYFTIATLSWRSRWWSLDEAIGGP